MDPWGAISQIIGVPGFVDDIGTWFQWGRLMLGIRSSGKKPSWRDFKRFKCLKPLIDKHTYLAQPSLYPNLRLFMNIDGFNNNYSNLRAHLDALEIPYPKVHPLSPAWDNFLLYLDILVRDGKLEAARLNTWDPSEMGWSTESRYRREDT